MVWEVESTRVPTSIGRIQLMLTDYDGVAVNHSLTFQVEVLDQTGERAIDRHGDLIPHLTEIQKQYLVTFLSDMRTKAEEEILPA